MRLLFDKSSIKKMQLKNRFFRAAVWEELATEDGHMTAELWKVYEELAQGGVGTILTGYAYVTEDEHPNPRMMGIYNDSFIPEYKQLTQMAHDNGANIIMQIVYGGSMTRLDPPSAHIWGPSAVKNELSGITPIEMTKEDIQALTTAFADAARRVKEAGFDGVELHAAHGYLLSQFLCPHFNVRTDEYGGCIENRVRIIAEILDAVRHEVGVDFPVLMKINSEDFMEDGLTSEESIAAVKLLASKGIDAVEVSGGNPSDPNVTKNNWASSRTKIVVSKERESYFREHAEKLAASVSIPVILTGGNRHYDVMDEILNTTQISYFALARPLICEPNLIKVWKSGNLKKPKCVSCNQCFLQHGRHCIFDQEK